MPYNRDELGYEAQAIRGAAALKEMLDQIGHPSGDDHRVAKILTDNELQLVALLTFAFDAIHQKI